jgi:autotransporter-associated beta strand protein
MSDAPSNQKTNTLHMLRKLDFPRADGRLSGLTTALALAVASFLHYSLAAPCAAQTRDDNRRLFYTGSNGATWDDNSTASWMTTGSYLAYANSGTASAVWIATPALAATPFHKGDTVVFDSASDIDPLSGDPAGTRTVTIADGGVTASDVITSGLGSFVFSGGAITADASSVTPGSVQLTGTGVAPRGRLVKVNDGKLTLSNTTANIFTGGILIVRGTLEIADARALGSNNITFTLSDQRTTHGSGTTWWLSTPGVVLDAAGTLLRSGTTASANGSITTWRAANTTLRVPSSVVGLDITGNLTLYSGTIPSILDIEGDTTISGRIVGAMNNYGSSGGSITKTGDGTLTITGSQNWFYGINILAAGKIVVKAPYALGTGAWTIEPAATLEFNGVTTTQKQSFIGGGDITITNGSDVTFNWFNGPLDDYGSMPDGWSVNQPADSVIGNLTVTGASRFTALAAGTQSGVLGGTQSQVTISDRSTLVIGREGVSSRSTAAAASPIHYPVFANTLYLSGSSTLVLNPNAHLRLGALVISDTTCLITFGASGVSRIRWNDGIDPANTDYFRLDYDGLAAAGMTLIVKVVIPPDSPDDNSSSGYSREFVVVNQGANPLKDIAMTLNAIDALHDSLSARLADELIDPVIRHAPARKRKWVNEAWMRYVTSEVDYDDAGIATPGITGRINGAIFGLDWLLPERVLLGVHGAAAENNLDTTNRTSLASKQKFLGLHAAQRFGKFYLAAAADTGRVHTDSSRTELNGSLVRGKWNTSYYTGAVQIGATFSPREKLLLKPYAGLRYAKLKLDGHNESGRNFSPLNVADFSDASAQAIYGLAVGQKFKLWKRDFAADLSVARKHAVRTPRETLVTHYYDSPDTPVTLERGDYYSDLTAIGLSARAALTRPPLVGLALDYETSSNHSRITGSLLVGCTW